MFLPPIRNCNASFFRRVPPQTLHGRYAINCSRHFCPFFDSSSSVACTYSAMPSQGIILRPDVDVNSDKSTVSGFGSPYKMAFIPSSEIVFTGSSSVKSYRLPSIVSRANILLFLYFPIGSIAPSLSDFSLSGIILSLSNTASVPKPLHRGQAPCGELNENECGAGSSNATPVEGHIRWRE